MNNDKDLDRHSIRCKICKHPQKEAIEKDIEDNLPLVEIAAKYAIAEKSIRNHVAYFFEDTDSEEEEVPVEEPSTLNPTEFLKSVIRKSTESRSVKVGDGITAAKELAKLQKQETDVKTLMEEGVLNALKSFGGFSTEQLDEYIVRVENLIKAIESSESPKARE